jgi:hypothetical protein
MTGMGRSEALIGVFAQKQIPPSTASRLPTPFFKGGKKPETRLFSALFAADREPGELQLLLAPFEKGGGHCNAMAGDLRL